MPAYERGVGAHAEAEGSASAADRMNQHEEWAYCRNDQCCERADHPQAGWPAGTSLRASASKGP